MANINQEASNTQKMREHQSRKLASMSLPSHEETDLIMCSSVVNLGNSIALNRNTSYIDLVSIMSANPNDLALVSGVDHQLLIKVNFKDPVTVTSVCFRAEAPPGTPCGVDASDSDTVDPSRCSGPKRVKCFANHEDLDFVDTETVNAAQVVELQPTQLKGDKIPLRGNRFSRCNSVQFFIEENQNDTEFTFLNRLCLWGRVAPAYHVDF